VAAGAAPALDVAKANGHPRLLLGPRLLETLRRRARDKRPEWQALAARCDALATATIEWPDGNDYPKDPGIGEGYQGDGYFDALVSLGLCYQVTRSKGHAAKGVDLLVKMSEPSGSHAVDPLRDAGFGIRFFVVGMALGFDWLYDALTAEQKSRIIAALERWMSAYEKKGFGRDHPQGNYFAGYYAAKGLAALATEGDDPKAAAAYSDWLERVHRKMVQPYYAAHLAGGGWPEGWNYGPLATTNMIWPVWAAQTAKGVDLVHGDRPFAFPIDQAKHLIHFTWPSRKTLDNRSIQYASDNPSPARPGLFVMLAGLLSLWGDPLAPAFHRYAREVLAASAPKPEPWQSFLFWDPSAPESDYRSEPLSFVATGMQAAAMRSSWEPGAVWATFTSGPYVNNPDSGEMYFDQGSLVVVRGDHEILVNAAAALQRHSPGTSDGAKIGDLVYDDLYGNNDQDSSRGNRTLFNIFYAKASRYGQTAMPPEKAKTSLARFEDRGTFVVLRGEHLEDMYLTPKSGGRPVAAWTRQVVYVRPELFVVDDRTSVTDGAADQWLAFHVSGRPAAASGGRVDLGSANAFGGVLTTLLPRGATSKTVDIFGKGKVFRVELRPALPGKEQRWLTVFDAAASPAQASRATLVSREEGSVRAGDVVGVALRGPKASSIVLSSAGTQAVSRPVSGEIRYLAPSAARHVLTDLPPSAGFAVKASGSGDRQEIMISPSSGGTLKSSESGTLSFAVAAAGTVSP
jgi:hypothetical protein